MVRLLRDVGCASVKELCYFASVTTAVVAALVKKGVWIHNIVAPVAEKEAAKK